MNFVAGIDAGLFVGLKLLDGNPDFFPGYGPSGVASFVLDFEVGFKVTFSWQTDIRGHQDGSEQRASVLDRPRQHYDGPAKLFIAQTRQTRARMARYAAQGAVFLLGLPHEALPLIDDAAGEVLTVPASALAAWDCKQPGQRVLVRHGANAIDAVIQDTAGSNITLDVAPGAAGALGGLVMPAMAIYFEPQQNFDRFKTAVESWTVAARAAIFDFCPPRAFIDLGTINAAWAGAFIEARAPGLPGNLITFQLEPFVSNPVGGVLFESIGTNTDAQMKGDTDTLGALATLLDTSDNVKLTGTYNAAAVIGSGDGFTQDLAGGEAAGAFGDGVALTMYDGQPVWNRRIKNASTNSEPINAQTDLVDLGGVPVAIGQANYPAWGRAVQIQSSDRTDWQWLKLMLATLRGAQGMFWLATWRPDLTWIAMGIQDPDTGTTQLKIATSDDVLAWYPAQRDRLQIQQADGTITYAQIVGSPVDNGDDTTTITVLALLANVDVTMLSWLEPCRFQGDDFEITWTGGFNFAMTAMARAFATSDPNVEETA